jgi:hypothetical protein
MTEAHDIFRTRCAACHGAEGRGDGPAARSLPVKPVDFADRSWQMKVTDSYVRTVIVKGGAAVGKSPLMTANPDLESKRGVVEGLVRIIRSVK